MQSSSEFYDTIVSRLRSGRDVIVGSGEEPPLPESAQCLAQAEYIRWAGHDESTWEPTDDQDWTLLRESNSRIGIATSGTTGRPKLIWHHMETLCRNVRHGAKYFDDKWGHAFAPASFAGLQVFFQALANRNFLLQLPPNVERARHLISQLQVTRLAATPTFMRMLCGADAISETIRSVTIGGERVDASMRETLRHSFPNAKIRNVYASTEAGAILSTDGDTFSVPPEFSEHVRVLENQLAIHRSLLATSLNEQLDESKFVEEYYLTGDVVEVVSISPLQFRFQMRRDDWVNVGGVKVNPLKVEEVLESLPFVRGARVFGQPNSVIGTILCCEIALLPESQMTAAELKAILRDKLSKHEIPQLITFGEDILMMSETGKKVRKTNHT